MSGNSTTIDPVYTLRYLVRMQERLAFAQEAEGKDASAVRRRAWELRVQISLLSQGVEAA
ncbi:hypothetical protein [Asticcacaulis sp. W401b]|uniref:hypothetical protein n=1 Tax=Asticcacaulis sp. W401b TaxID=3388666 RepID=UPI003970D68F